MRLVVTGASGFVGRGLLDWLAGRGHGGLATGRTPPACRQPAWQGVGRGDLLSGEFDAGRVDAVVHMEVKQHVPRPTVADVEAFRQGNVVGTREWLDWTASRGIRRLVFTSSVKAVPADDPREEVGVAGDPGSPYGRSKADAERLVRDWAADDPGRAAVILRPAPVYGPGNEANLAAFVRQIVAGRPCLVGRGDTRKSVVSRTNLAAAIEFAAARMQQGCEVYNVSDLETYSLAELAALVAELAAARPPRSIPLALAGCVATVGDLVTGLFGGDFPLTSARLRALREASVFPCDKLVAAGFHHPQSTREGLAELVAALA
jgi:nucleoside-diphosphate-sugar epimerase